MLVVGDSFGVNVCAGAGSGVRVIVGMVVKVDFGSANGVDVGFSVELVFSSCVGSAVLAVVVVFTSLVVVVILRYICLVFSGS